MEEFLLGNIIDAIVSQVMISLNEKSIQLIHNIPEETKTLHLYGDQMKLQLLLSDFLLSVVHHAPSNGWVEVKVSLGLKLIQDGCEYIHIKFRYMKHISLVPCFIYLLNYYFLYLDNILAWSY